MQQSEKHVVMFRLTSHLKLTSFCNTRDKHQIQSTELLSYLQAKIIYQILPRLFPTEIGEKAKPLKEPHEFKG